MEDAGIRADGEGEEKAASNGLQRAVWLRQMLHRWQSSSSSSSSATAAKTSSVTSAVHDGTSGPDDASTDRNNDDDDDDATTPAAGNNSDDSERNPLLAAPASEERRRLPRVAVVEERGRPDDGAVAEACSSPMTPMTPDSPAGVPRGCCPVYVGAERRRFVVPTSYLGMPVFRRLLEKAEEEFEFHYHGGALTIPCDTEAFKYILVVMSRHRQGLVDDEGNAKDGEQQDGSPVR